MGTVFTVDNKQTSQRQRVKLCSRSSEERRDARDKPQAQNEVRPVVVVPTARDNERKRERKKEKRVNCGDQ